MLMNDKQSAVYQIGTAKYFQYPLSAFQKIKLFGLLKPLAAKVVPQAMEKANPLSIFSSVVDYFDEESLFSFLGLVLFKEGEDPLIHASVRSFSDRGSLIAAQMTQGQEREVFADFFPLNRGEAREYLKLFHIDLDNLQKTVSVGLKKASGALSNSSPTDGDKSPT